MAEHGDLQELAERIVKDKRSLEIIFRNRAHDQIEMLAMIKMVEKEWFLRLWVDETGSRLGVRFNPTEKAVEKIRSRKPEKEAEEEAEEQAQ